MKKLPNIITSFRILLSLGLIFAPVGTAAFYVIYVIAGLSDILDGFLARKLGAESELGSKLDTAADFVLIAVCLYKLIPALALKTYMIFWLVWIAAMKVANVIIAYIREEKFVVVHSVLNKITGAVLFVLPLTMGFIKTEYSLIPVLTLATVAAIDERYEMKKR